MAIAAGDRETPNANILSNYCSLSPGPNTDHVESEIGFALGALNSWIS